MQHLPRNFPIIMITSSVLVSIICLTSVQAHPRYDTTGRRIDIHDRMTGQSGIHSRSSDQKYFDSYEDYANNDYDYYATPYYSIRDHPKNYRTVFAFQEGCREGYLYNKDRLCEKIVERKPRHRNRSFPDNSADKLAENIKALKAKREAEKH